MTKRRAYFSTGEIIETCSGKAHFKRCVARTLDFEDHTIKVWFRDCKAWRDAVDKDTHKWIWWRNKDGVACVMRTK